jgi:hypothetical protein
MNKNLDLMRSLDGKLAGVVATLNHTTALYNQKKSQLESKLKLVRDVCGQDQFEDVKMHYSESKQQLDG